jgi:anti-anti-sigma factor
MTIPAPPMSKRPSHLSFVAVASFDVELLEAPGSEVTLVALTGELDLTNVHDLDERLAVVANGLPIVLDLGRLAFVDSAALQHIFRIARERGRSGVAFVVEPTAPVAATLAIVELGRAATLVESSEDAVAALRRARSS